MADPPPPEWTDLGPGCQEVRFATLKQFVDYLYSDLLEFGTYIWRGQRCETWKLEPTLDRLVREGKTPDVHDWDFAKRHLTAFKQAVRGRRGPNPVTPADENEWWALGQHHGLATPLLDWTTSPFVATFFAFAELGPEQTPCRAIYALHQPSIERVVKIARHDEDVRREERRAEMAREGRTPGLLEFALTAKAEPDLVFVRPHSDENQRLVAQGGLFTRSNTSMPIEDWVLKHHDTGDNSLTLLKCLVPDEERARCLRLLNRMNINPLALFPDVTGASRYCNLFSEVENY